MKKLFFFIAATCLMFTAVINNSFAVKNSYAKISRDTTSCCDTLPEITINGDSVICYGDSSLLCVSDTDSCYNYMWLHEGDTISYSSCVLVNDSGYYQVVVWNNCDTVYSSYFNLTVNHPVVNIINLHYHQCITCGYYAEAVVYGGCGYYSYLWSSGGTTSTVDSLCYGTVCVTVTDSCGCTAVDCDYTPALRSFTASITCYNSGICTLTAVGSGGQPPYTYLWSTGATTQSINAPLSIIYYVTITDAAGCTRVASRKCNCLPSKSAQSEEMNFKIYPNPASTSITIDSESPQIGTCVVTLSDVTGKIIIQKEYNVTNSSFELNVEDLPRGMYFIEINDKETTYKEKIILN